MSKITVKLMQPYRPWGGKRVVFSIAGWKHPVEISVYPITDGEFIDYYGVNWPAIGTVPPDVGAEFMGSLSVAIATARLLTKKYKGRSRY